MKKFFVIIFLINQIIWVIEQLIIWLIKKNAHEINVTE